ncbi:nuclear transport factor 2 family protein [Leptospira sp. 96542]|nr:nuclear transport factor 2 family protein [Leptospira sp. 96542]
MKLKLPVPIETYIQASNDSDLKKVLSCFTDTATVLDEGKILTGHNAIGKWFRKTRSKYQFKSSPIALKGKDKKLILTAEVSGNFPGSPITLDYQFQIVSDLIQDLRIG